ncbi:MAG: hypothetical protein IJY65_05480 [Clostridia bacterium]|nr:hypothetical protein [Clostridia bacterium]
MKLSIKDIRKITFGALSVTEENGVFTFHRFTDEQKSVYATEHPEFRRRSDSTASVILDFLTDSDILSFDYETESKVGPHRDYAFFDIWENDVMIAHKGAYFEELRQDSVSIKLSSGKKRVRVFFPNLFKMTVSNFTLSDGAELIPIKKKLRALILGDSITHGYEAHFPSLTYANTIIRNFELDAVNQAIGGEIFRPSILGSAPLFDPDIVTVALGTNDWSGATLSLERCRVYFETLKKFYSRARIFYISPIWRKDFERKTDVGSFSAAVLALEKLADELNITVIHGAELAHHTEEFFTDGLHPNDLGFAQYAVALTEKLKALGVEKL